MQQQASIEIDRPIGEVFEYTNSHVPEWSLTVVEDTPIDTARDGGIGSTFRCTTETNGARMEFAGTVTKWDPPFVSAVNLIGKQFDIDVLYTFEKVNTGTRVTQVSVVHAKSFITKAMFFLIGRFASKANCDAAMKEMKSLKEKLETRID